MLHRKFRLQFGGVAAAAYDKSVGYLIIYLLINLQYFNVYLLGSILMENRCGFQ